MRIKFEGNYKCISSFDWKDIAPVSIVTGPNGVGKTQLLSLIQESTRKELYSFRKEEPKAQILEIEFAESDVVSGLGYRGSYGNAKADVTSIGTKIDEIYRLFQAYQGIPEENQLLEPTEFDIDGDPIYKEPAGIASIKYIDLFESIVRKTGKEKKLISKEEFLYFLPLKELKNEGFGESDFSGYFFNYRLTWIDEVVIKKRTAKSFRKRHGMEPWKILQRLIDVAKLPIRFTTPENLSFRDKYEMEFFHVDTNAKVSYYDLSSGEQTIMSLVFALHNSREFKTVPKLMLLDEPDAHLHPSMIKQFLDVVTEVLAKEFGVSIIMTTHSASTVALAKMNGHCKIYEMKRKPFSIHETPNVDDLIEQLSEGLILVRPSSKFILVEGKDDQPFYTEVLRKLKEIGAIVAGKAAVFVPGQGKGSVIHWADHLKEAGLKGVIAGIVDRDSEKTTLSYGVEMLERHSIENYLLDPIVVFATLLNSKKAIAITGIEIHSGEESKLQTMSDSDLQKIANTILKSIRPKLSDVSNDLDAEMLIEFVNGKTLSYPKWIVEYRGKDLLSTFQQHFDASIKPPILIANLKRTAMIPVELCDLLVRVL